MTKVAVLLLLGAFNGASLVAASPPGALRYPVCAPSTAEQPPAPRILEVERSPRRDGVWHLVSVSFEGNKQASYQLELQWEAQTPKEDGQGTTNSKSKRVRTDGKGIGQWKVEVRGYPAGTMRARVVDEAGAVSEWSAGFEVPWIY